MTTKYHRCWLFVTNSRDNISSKSLGRFAVETITKLRPPTMQVQNCDSTRTPLNERIRYFLEVMVWSMVIFCVIIVLVFIVERILYRDLPPAFPGNPDYSSDRAFCLEIRPKSELRQCMSEYGWFDRTGPGT